MYDMTRKQQRLSSHQSAPVSLLNKQISFRIYAEYVKKEFKVAKMCATDWYSRLGIPWKHDKIPSYDKNHDRFRIIDLNKLIDQMYTRRLLFIHIHICVNVYASKKTKKLSVFFLSLCINNNNFQIFFIPTTAFIKTWTRKSMWEQNKILACIGICYAKHPIKGVIWYERK